MVLASLPLCAQTAVLIDDGLKIVGPQLVDQAMLTRTWLGSKHVSIKSLKYLSLLCIDTWLKSDIAMQRELSLIAGESPSEEVQG